MASLLTPPPPLILPYSPKNTPLIHLLYVARPGTQKKRFRLFGVLGTCFYEHLYCTDSYVLLFLYLLTNVIIVNLFG